MRRKPAYPTLRAYLVAAKAQGRSHTEVAQELGIALGYLSDLKSGRTQPSLDLALKIERLANVPLESMVKQ